MICVFQIIASASLHEYGMFVTTRRNRNSTCPRYYAAGLLSLGLVITCIVTFEKSAVGTKPTNPQRSIGQPPVEMQSTGHAEQTLPDDLQVLWEYKADEAIETTPVVAEVGFSCPTSWGKSTLSIVRQRRNLESRFRYRILATSSPVRSRGDWGH